MIQPLWSSRERNRATRAPSISSPTFHHSSRPSISRRTIVRSTCTSSLVSSPFPAEVMGLPGKQIFGISSQFRGRKQRFMYVTTIIKLICTLLISSYYLKWIFIRWRIHSTCCVEHYASLYLLYMIPRFDFSICEREFCTLTASMTTEV